MCASVCFLRDKTLLIKFGGVGILVENKNSVLQCVSILLKSVFMQLILCMVGLLLL